MGRTVLTSDQQDDRPSRSAQQNARPLGVAECERAIMTIRRYRDLTHHKENRGSSYGVQSLEELFPRKKYPRAKEESWGLIATELSASVGIVTAHVRRAGIPTKCMVGNLTVDVISDYEYWPDRSFQWEFTRFDALMRVLNATIGSYQHRLEVAKRERWNPLVWIAWVLRWPKYVLEYSGLAHGENASEKALTFWKWILPYAVGVITTPLLQRLCTWVFRDSSG